MGLLTFTSTPDEKSLMTEAMAVFDRPLTAAPAVGGLEAKEQTYQTPDGTAVVSKIANQVLINLKAW